MAIYPTVDEIFLSGPNWWAAHLTDIAIHTEVPLAWLNFKQKFGLQNVMDIDWVIILIFEFILTS